MSDKSVTLHWSGEGLRFHGGPPGGPEIQIDSDGKAGPSPMDAVLLSVAGCMGIDVVMILEKGRVPVTGLSVQVEGDRSARPPRRFTAIRMTYRVEGVLPEHHARVERAVALSRDRYCSVLHTLRPDMEMDIQVRYA